MNMAARPVFCKNSEVSSGAMCQPRSDLDPPPGQADPERSRADSLLRSGHAILSEAPAFAAELSLVTLVYHPLRELLTNPTDSLLLWATFPHLTQ